MGKQLHSFTKYLRQALVFMWNSANFLHRIVYLAKKNFTQHNRFKGICCIIFYKKGHQYPKMDKCGALLYYSIKLNSSEVLPQ